MSLPVAQLLVRAAQASDASDLRLLTAITSAGVSGGYLDPYAVDCFIDAQFQVRSLLNLHAKVVLADSWGTLGSGNLTAAGVNGGNAELGIVLTRTQASRAQADHFEPWWKAAQPVNRAAMHKLAREHRPKDPQRQQRRGQGGIYKTSAGRELDSFSKDKNNSGYWLKIMYGDQALSARSGWRGLDWVSDAHVIRNGKPIRRPSYAIGDHLVTYLSRVERPACPAILRVVDEPRFDPKLVAREAPGAEDRWAWVTPVEVVAVTDLQRAPLLRDLEVAGRSVNQQGHIRLTPAQYRAALRAIKN
jgi:hypothetical protein